MDWRCLSYRWIKPSYHKIAFYNYSNISLGILPLVGYIPLKNIPTRIYQNIPWIKFGFQSPLAIIPHKLNAEERKAMYNSHFKSEYLPVLQFLYKGIFIVAVTVFIRNFIRWKIKWYKLLHIWRNNIFLDDE